MSSGRLAGAPVTSVLMPAFDAATTLPRALASIVRQTDEDWECVVVDDGSTDATARVVTSFTQRDPRFRLLKLEHVGIVSALNSGLAACRGVLTLRMDADDVMAVDRVATQRAALDADPTLVGVGAHVRIFPRGALRPGRLDYEAFLNGIECPADVRANAFVECPLAHPTFAFRTSALRRFGYRDRGWPEDYDLVLRVLADGGRLGVVPRVLLRWRDSPTRLSRIGAAYARERFVDCKAEFLAAGPLARVSQYVLWGYGDTGKALRRALDRHGKSPRAIVELHPRRLGQRIHGAPVIPPAEVARLRGVPLLTSVAGAAARAQLRASLTSLGWHEGSEFWCTA